MRPAYLEITETSPGSIDITWKVPKSQNASSDLAPELPASFAMASRVENIDSPDALLRKWSMIGLPLNGQLIRIRGLEQVSMEALVRIQMADGTLIRTVLNPGSPQLSLPEVGNNKKSVQHGWIYIGVLFAAFGLSLTRSARKSGIVLCSLALLAGGLTGHALGNRIPGHRKLSESETKRILQGLMLNTYRAFIFDDDTEVYNILARSVEGQALNDIYLNNRSRLSFDDAESASSLVDRLDIKSIEFIDKDRQGSITLLTDWDVYGSVFHWEHVHFRCNTFKAEITIAPFDGYWKITALNILEEERVL